MTILWIGVIKKFSIFTKSVENLLKLTIAYMQLNSKVLIFVEIMLVLTKCLLILRRKSVDINYITANI